MRESHRYPAPSLGLLARPIPHRIDSVIRAQALSVNPGPFYGVTPVTRLLAGEMMVHLGIQGSLGQRLFQPVEKSVRIEGRLGIGPSQKLVQDGIRNTRFFASRHGWAPFHPSCPTHTRNSG